MRDDKMQLNIDGQLIYYGFEIEEAPAIGDIPARITITYDFEMPGIATFAPSWEIPCDRENVADDDAVLAKIFFLGMAELVYCLPKLKSYEIIVEPFALTQEQIAVWKETYCDILALRFKQNADETIPEISIVSEGEELVPDYENKTEKREKTLIPVQTDYETDCILEQSCKEWLQEVFYVINADEKCMQKLTAYGCKNVISVCRSINTDNPEAEHNLSEKGEQNISLLVAYSASLVAELFDLKDTFYRNSFGIDVEKY